MTTAATCYFCGCSATFPIVVEKEAPGWTCCDLGLARAVLTADPHDRAARDVLLFALANSPAVLAAQARLEHLGRDCGTDPYGRAWPADRHHHAAALDALWSAAAQAVTP